MSIDHLKKQATQEPIAQSSDNPAANAQVLEVVPTPPLTRAAMIAIALFTAFVLFFWGLHSTRARDPYVQSVLQLTGDPIRGEGIFVLNCATCHGLKAAGEVGPSLERISERRSKIGIIEQVTSGQTPPMPQFQPTEKDMADLLSFLEKI